jgi:autotransporter-associated beta strand protein
VQRRSQGDALVFDGFGRLTSNTNNFAAGTAFNGISFASSAGGFTLAGNQIDLTGNLVDDTAVLTQIVNNNLIFGATRDVSVANTGTLRLGGIVSGAGGIHKLGEGILVLGGANTFTGAVDIGAGRLQISADNNLGAAPGAATANQLIIDGIGGVPADHRHLHA